MHPFVFLFIFFLNLACKLEWNNPGDPTTQAFWETRVTEEWIVAHPRPFTIRGMVTGLNNSPVVILSPSDGSYTSVSANGSFELSVFASPKYIQLDFSTQPTDVHCMLWDLGTWTGDGFINTKITCPFVRTVVSGKTLLWDRCTYGSSWNPDGTSIGVGKGDCSLGTAQTLNFCTSAEGYNSSSNPNACNGGVNTQHVNIGPVFQSCSSRNLASAYLRKNWRLPLYTEMFSVIRCSATNTAEITGEDGCATVGDYTKYSGATADPVLFPNAQVFRYWSSQTFPALGDEQAYTVNFNLGNQSYEFKDATGYVRCVSDL
ncbi:DUF1566 domain-containing protein [Leptospira congkakensis]|uniref:DUF1566 domain-containing protein n=1 Tax=Leptospira congkakensis TaxID=2484932 RepID=A0A4Z1AIP5_9LEPT|nr:DUF1566 domain-containing protein [Leptospira congkakensis]TGL92022.1 DUF1566 domain-containing protein [Leptospira congkakensis]TGL99068.1 DUF1566 domain-containing protein [Leptospira congkakensis]